MYIAKKCHFLMVFFNGVLSNVRSVCQRAAANSDC
jgi:hypothetical protein